MNDKIFLQYHSFNHTILIEKIKNYKRMSLQKEKKQKPKSIYIIVHLNHLKNRLKNRLNLVAYILS